MKFMKIKTKPAWKNMYLFVIIAVFLAVYMFMYGCSTPKSVVRIVNDSVVYDGPINIDNANALLSILESTGIKIIFINSQGGSSEAGLKIGDFVVKNNISVVVVGACHSACANYVFLPSKNRKAVKSANIGMHGGYQSYIVQRLALLQNLPDNIKSMYEGSFAAEDIHINREIFLLKNAGINPEIINESANKTLYGEAIFVVNTDGKKREYKAEEVRKSEYELWFPAEKNYKKWGIDIEIIDYPRFLPLFCYKKFKISNS
jgi:hypothetical protein